MDARAPLTRVPLVDEVLGPYRARIGEDWAGYRNHVLRVLNFCRALSGEDALPEALVVAAAFHDLGIWSDGTFDYIEPSAAHAASWLHSPGRPREGDAVRTVVPMDHNVRPSAAAAAFQSSQRPLTEAGAPARSTRCSR